MPKCRREQQGLISDVQVRSFAGARMCCSECWWPGTQEVVTSPAVAVGKAVVVYGEWGLRPSSFTSG